MDGDKLEKIIMNGVGLSMGALSVSLHTLRILTNRGLVSPNEIESVYSMLTETLERFSTEETQAAFGANVGQMMGDLRQLAKERWIGKDEPDPEPLHG